MEFERDPTTHKLIKSPETYLMTRVKEHHIPIERNLGNWIMDKRYAQYDAHDDYDKINRAIDYAIKYDSFKDIPPPIIAVGGTVHGVPVLYLIKTDVPTYRKKKTTKPKKRVTKKCGCK
jgi:hypothetical protein